MRLTPEQVRARAAEYKTKAEEVQDVIDYLTQVMARLRDDFDADSAMAFEEKYLELKPGLETGQRNISWMSNACTVMADTFETTDRELASTVRNA